MHEGVSCIRVKERFGCCAGRQLLNQVPHCSVSQGIIFSQGIQFGRVRYLLCIKTDWIKQTHQMEKLTQC